MTLRVRNAGRPDRFRTADAAAESGNSSPGAPGHCEVSPGSGVTRLDIERIVALSGLSGGLSDPARQSAFAFVEYSERKYKVLAYADAASARGRFALLGRTAGLFAPCLGRVENCLVHEYVEGSGDGGDSSPGNGIGNFLADLSGIEAEPMHEPDFDAWSLTLAAKRILLRRTAGALRRYIAGALVTPIRWDLEYLDAVPKNFVYAGKGRLICIDSKHLHPGPQGVSLAKLYSNIGTYCRREDYAAIRSVYQKRVRDNRLDDPAYFEFLLLFYSLFFLVANARRFSWKLNVENGMNRFRKKTVLGIIGASPWICFLEGLWWGAALGLFWILRFPGRALRYALRRAGGGSGINTG